LQVVWLVQGTVTGLFVYWGIAPPPLFNPWLCLWAGSEVVIFLSNEVFALQWCQPGADSYFPSRFMGWKGIKLFEVRVTNYQKDERWWQQ